jgi:hypothetical protein
MYKYELFILSDILNYKIIVVNQYDEKVMEYNLNNSETITVKYEIYNNIITKFFVIYNI